MSMELPERFDEDPNDFVIFIEPARTNDPDKTRLDVTAMVAAGCVTKNEVRCAFSLPPLPEGMGGDDLIKPAQQSSNANQGGGRADPSGGTDFRTPMVKGHAVVKNLWLKAHAAG